MPRKKRIWYSGACYHLMGRGNRHCAIFQEKEDYIIFLHLLYAIRERYPFILHACCLMTNHFHLEITTLSDPVWKLMQPLMNHYARNFNQKYGYDGHLFDSRYCSGLIEDDTYFLEVSRYIHLNPVKAQMVRSPLDYEYSSYGLFVNQDMNADDSPVGKLISDLVDTSRVHSCFRYDPREQYRMFVEGKISHAEQEMLIQKDMKEDDMWLPW